MSQTIIITCLSITLLYADGSTWYVGDFSSQSAVDSWVNTEKTRPYWENSTIIQTVDKSISVTL